MPCRAFSCDLPTSAPDDPDGMHPDCHPDADPGPCASCGQPLEDLTDLILGVPAGRILAHADAHVDEVCPDPRTQEPMPVAAGTFTGHITRTRRPNVTALERALHVRDAADKRLERARNGREHAAALTDAAAAQRDVMRLRSPVDTES